MAATSIFLIITASASGGWGVLWKSEISKLLLCSILPFLLFIFIAKFDLGLGKDWDVSASFFFLIALYGAYIFSSIEPLDVRTMNIMITTTLLNSLLYVGLNSTVEPCISRMKALLDKRIVPEGAFFQGSFHLSMYYFHQHDPQKMITLWRSFLQEFPDYSTGYEKLVKAYWELGEPGYDSISVAYEQWMKTDPQNNGVKLAYGNFLLNEGNTFYSEGKFSSAKTAFQKALELNPAQPAIYNNLGLLYLDSARYDSAADLFQKAITLDGNYAIGYKNLGNVYLDKGDPRNAIVWYQKATSVDPSYTGAFELMARAYDMLGDRNNVIASYARAARLGSTTAQQFLTDNGYSW
jgi:tetratricopeptide (TPR) repeat protein